MSDTNIAVLPDGVFTALTGLLSADAQAARPSVSYVPSADIFVPASGEVIIVMGPTASGKTAFSVNLAKKIDAEIVSADSMQIYRGMDIGTAKASIEERGGIPHHMIDIIDPDERFSVAEYKSAALRCIKDIMARGKNAVVAGGTGLYISALVYNIKYADFAIDETIRTRLDREAETRGLAALYAELCEIDGVAASKIHMNDKKRVIRALEIFHATGETLTAHERRSRLEPPEYKYRLFALGVPRDVLYQRINARVDSMITHGLLPEARRLFQRYGVLTAAEPSAAEATEPSAVGVPPVFEVPSPIPTALQAIGYKELLAYFRGDCNLDESVELIKRETRRYAKRQLSWFRRMDGVTWLS